MPPLVKFYFDVISPYAWLAWRPLNEIAVRHSIAIEPVPVLFAGLLAANGQLGPAEIPRKRLWLIKDVMRRAEAQGLKVNPPPTHPFNPLLPLRTLSIDMDAKIKNDLVSALLDSVWQHGQDLSNPAVMQNICSKMGLNGAECVKDASENTVIKDRLKSNTEAAVSSGVFGVPTTSVDGELFWGSEIDTMNHIESSILGKDPIDQGVYSRWENIAASAKRKR